MDNWSLYWFGNIVELLGNRLTDSDYKILSASVNITMNTIVVHKTLVWDWLYVSQNKHITIEDIQKYPTIPWNINQLSTHIKNFTIDSSLCVSLSKNSNINWQDINSNPLLPWDWYSLSKNESILFDTIISNDKPWDFTAVSMNPNIKIDNVVNTPNLKWNYTILSKHPNITIDFMLTNKKGWDINFISQNQNITIDIVKNNKIKWNWNWFYVSANKGIKLCDIESNPLLPWDWNGISGNPNLTFAFIRKHKHKTWCIGTVLSNTFESDRNIFLNLITKHRQLFSLIEEELMKYIWHPSRYNTWKFLDDEII